MKLDANCPDDNGKKIKTQICVYFFSLIESGVCSLGEMLQLLLRTFATTTGGAGGSNSSPRLDNAAILQLFLETYFTELLSSTWSTPQVGGWRWEVQGQPGKHIISTSPSIFRGCYYLLPYLTILTRYP